MRTTILAATAIWALGGAAFAQDAATETEQAAETTAAEVDDGAEATGEAVEEGAEATGEAVEDGAEATGEAIDEGLDEAGAALEEAAVETKEAVDEVVANDAPPETPDTSGEVFPAKTGQNLFGGRVQTRRSRVLYATLGFPKSQVGVRFGLGKVDLGAYAGVAYGGGNYLGNYGNIASFEVGLDARFQVFTSGIWAGAVTVEAPLAIGFDANAPPNFAIGLLRPGFMVTATVVDRLDLDFGVVLEDDIVIFNNNTVGAIFRLPLVFGVEIMIIDRLQIGFRGHAGPAFAVGPGAGFPGATGGGVVAVGWSF